MGSGKSVAIFRTTVALDQGTSRSTVRVGSDPSDWSGTLTNATGDNVYTILELKSFVAAHKVPPLPAEPTFLISTPTKRNPLPHPNGMLAAEILIPTPNEQFPTPYLYVSNRDDPSPEGDTISIFSIADDALDLISEVPTGLNHVRGIAIGGLNSEWLIAGGTKGGGVKIFQRVEEGKNLKQVAYNPDVQSPTGFAWL